MIIQFEVKIHTLASVCEILLVTYSKWSFNTELQIREVPINDGIASLFKYFL